VQSALLLRLVVSLTPVGHKVAGAMKPFQFDFKLSALFLRLSRDRRDKNRETEPLAIDYTV